MTGTLKVRVDGAWVPVAPGAPVGAYVGDPAYVGRRRDGADAAQFTHKASPTRAGLIVFGDGTITNIIKAGSKFQWSEVAADGVTETWFADLSKAVGLQIGNGIFSGAHPSHGGNYWGIWPGSDPLNYMLMRDDSNGQTLINATGGICLRLNNSNVVRVESVPQVTVDGDITTTGMSERGKIVSAMVSWNTGWSMAHVMAYPTSQMQAHISWHHPGNAAQIQFHNSVGQLQVIDLNGSGYTSIAASAFTVSSALAVKNDVRSLSPHRERIIVRLDPRSEVVTAPDVMALRPITYRPKTGALGIAGPNGEDEYTLDNWKAIPNPDPILNLEGRRERLGLIADEVQHVVPSAVTHDVDGNCVGIDYAQITVALLDHVQELTRTVETLRYRITELEGAQP